MIARLEHMLESQRRLLADTSHELRNPITIIRGNLALLRREGVPESTRREAVVEAEEESARMGRLVGDLLLLARADAGGAPSLQLEPVDLAELASEVVEQARPRARDRRMSLAIEGRVRRGRRPRSAEAADRQPGRECDSLYAQKWPHRSAGHRRIRTPGVQQRGQVRSFSKCT